ncbi:hypothetical protein [Mycobacterium rhizamassiliense]|uniref:hypothetical protein n=1 Tax=Mycobacterium rhizamassiliense TaxID=1841860 RepID=UPI0009FB7621|nr:hypothetical protein [Mycobacterium rhizamassiliense]
MMRPRVEFIDTSVFCHLIEVPGRTTAQESAHFGDEFKVRYANGVRFVLPITTIVETGNFIVQCSDPHPVAVRFHKALELAASDEPPWILHDLAWNGEFIRELLVGNGTGTTLVNHFATKALGAGDLTILVERDRYARTRSFAAVDIWTTDGKFNAYRPHLPAKHAEAIRNRLRKK